MIAAILERHGLRTGAYLSPAPGLLPRARADRRARARRGGVRGGDRARVVGGRARQPHARRGRPRHPVRTADGRRAVGDGRQRGGRRGRGGRARRALRRDQRDRRARDGAHERRARAHPLARADRRRHRRGEARGRAPATARSCSARTLPRRRSPLPSGWRASERRGSCGRARARPAIAAARARRLPAAQLRARAGRRGGLSASRRHPRATSTPSSRPAAGHGCARAPAAGRARPADDPRRRAQPRRGRARSWSRSPRCSASARWRSCSACSRTRTRRRCSLRCCRACERAWFTAPPSSRALSPAALQSLARQLGFDAAASESSPAARSSRRRLGASTRRATHGAAASQRGGVAVLATGSVYLVGDLLGERASARMLSRAARRSSAG